MDEPGGAADPGVNLDDGNRAVPGAGTAFHAGITVNKVDPLAGKGEHLVRTDLDAPPAPDATRRPDLQGRYVFEITECFHRSPPIRVVSDE